MSRFLSLFTIFFLLIASISTTQASAETRIGLSLPLSGPIQNLGNQFLKGAELALADHNLVSSEKVGLTVADDGCSTEMASLAHETFIQAEVAIVTGVLCNDVARELAKTLHKAKLPILVAGARSQRIISEAKKEGWQLWRLSQADKTSAIQAAELLSKHWINKAYAIVDDGTVHGRLAADEFRSHMEELGLPPQFQDNYRPTQSTQARLVRRLNKAGITHVFIGGSAEDVTMISRNAEELEIELIIAGNETLDVIPYFDKKQRPADGLLAVLNENSFQFKIDKTLPKSLASIKDQWSDNLFLGYQAMQIALQAADRTVGQTKYKLSTKDFDTISGKVKFGTNRTNSISSYALYQWQNDKFLKFN